MQLSTFIMDHRKQSRYIFKHRGQAAYIRPLTSQWAEAFDALGCLSTDVSLDSPDPILERIHIEDTSDGGKGKESSFLVYQSSLLDEVSSPVRREVANRSFLGKVINRISDVENGKLEIKEKSIRNNMLVNVHNKALLSGIAYCISSCSMILVNKYVLSSYNFNAGISLMLYQNFVSVVVVSMLSFFGLISTEPLKLRLIKVWLPVNVIFVGMLITSILSLKYLNVAMVTVLKNVTNVITAVGEMYIFNKRHDSRVWTALFLMPALVLYLAILLFLFFLTFGFGYTSVERRIYQKQPLYSKEVEIVSAVSGGITDLSFHATGYTWQIINCFLTASYSLTLRRIMDTAKQVTKSGNLDEFSMVLLNNTLSLPLGLLLVLLFNEVDYLSTTPLLQLPAFWIVTTLSGFLGLAISFTSMWFLHQTSATTYSLVGSLNKIPLSLAGIILFNVPTRLDNTASICFGLLAGVFFARAKMQEKSQS